MEQPVEPTPHVSLEADGSPAQRRDAEAAAIGILAGLAAVPLQGYCWTGWAIASSVLAVAAAATWNRVKGTPARRRLLIGLGAWALLPFGVAVATRGMLTFVLVLLGFASALLALAASARGRQRGWLPAVRPTLNLWALAPIAAILGTVVEYAVGPHADDGMLQPLLMGVLISAFAVCTSGLPVLGAVLPEGWGTCLPARMGLRLLGVAATVGLFRLIVAVIGSVDGPLSTLAFTTVGQTFTWWAPTLASLFALEAYAAGRRQRRRLALAAGLLLCAAVAMDRTDPLFCRVARSGKPEALPAEQLRIVASGSYPPSWRPEMPGDDLFGDWSVASEHARWELARRGAWPSTTAATGTGTR